MNRSVSITLGNIMSADITSGRRGWRVTGFGSKAVCIHAAFWWVLLLCYLLHCSKRAVFLCAFVTMNKIWIYLQQLVSSQWHFIHCIVSQLTEPVGTTVSMWGPWKILKLRTGPPDSEKFGNHGYRVPSLEGYVKVSSSKNWWVLYIFCAV